MSIAVRPAAPADAALVLALVRELAEYERLAHEAVATPQMIAQALFCQSPRVFCEIAESDGEPAGFALWFYSFSTFAGLHGIYLEDLFVRPAARARGLGKALLAGLAQRCQREGLARLEWSVLDWNAPSIAFYKAQGAAMVNGWTRCRMDGAALARLGGLASRAIAPDEPR